MELSSILSKKEIVKALEHKKNILIDEWQIIDSSLINDRDMPEMIRELRTIEAEAMEYHIRLLDKRINKIQQK